MCAEETWCTLSRVYASRQVRSISPTVARGERERCSDGDSASNVRVPVRTRIRRVLWIGIRLKRTSLRLATGGYIDAQCVSLRDITDAKAKKTCLAPGALGAIRRS